MILSGGGVRLLSWSDFEANDYFPYVVLFLLTFVISIIVLLACLSNRMDCYVFSNCVDFSSIVISHFPLVSYNCVSMLTLQNLAVVSKFNYDYNYVFSSSSFHANEL